MKNYAKFCKIKVKDDKYQLNLTENGIDSSGTFNKIVSIVRWGAPLYGLYVIVKNIVTFALFKMIDVNDVSHLISSLILTAGTFTPFTVLGNSFNSIFKSFIIKHKLKKYYENMRMFEKAKMNAKSSKLIDRNLENQIKITRKLVRFLKRETKRCERLTKPYYKKQERNGELSNLKEYALENIEMNQEAIDKFIFHNYGLLIKLAPKDKEFLQERFEFRYSTIKDGDPYYDEYVWSASHDENLIKNDCIVKGEESNYLNALKKVFNLKNYDEVDFGEYSTNDKDLNNKKLTKQDSAEVKVMPPQKSIYKDMNI